MNNSKKWKDKKRANNNSGKGRNNSNNGGYNSSYGGNSWGKTNNGSKKNRSKGGGRQFQKFVDTEHLNYEPNYWPQNNWSCDNSRNDDYQFNETLNHSGGIYAWIRNKPDNQLIIPRHINFEEHYERSHQESDATNIDAVQRKNVSAEVRNEPLNVISKETNATKPQNNTELPQVQQPSGTNNCVNIKQEKDLLINLKQEKKSSSSSSSSSDSSSSEEEVDHNNKASVSVKPEITSVAKPPCSPLNINLKSRTSSVSSTQIKISDKIKPLPEMSSSSSSTSDEESSIAPSTSKAEKTGNKKEKVVSEDEVVCVGNLANKIILEDESDSTSSDKDPGDKTPENILKKSEKQTSEKCMICDKKGHTSFQCQMICKNCSAPYHGYRTCPHPPNLNTMMQLFIEFCMQQLQNFQVENQSSTSNGNNVPKPKVDSPHLASGSSRSNKLKRKPSRANESSKKHKKSKKRRVFSSKKTKSKANSDESSDDDSEDQSDAGRSSTASDELISDSSAQSLVSSKKKRKLKNATTSKATLDLSSFSSNSVGLPVVLNGFPHLTVPTTSLQNSNTSANALNTLLLAQMFQNGIGSLKK